MENSMRPNTLEASFERLQGFTQFEMESGEVAVFNLGPDSFDPP
jgi:hypothetical protein